MIIIDGLIKVLVVIVDVAVLWIIFHWMAQVGKRIHLNKNQGQDPLKKESNYWW